MSTTEDVRGRTGCPRWMKALLVLSLTANVAIVGLVLGHRMKDDDRPRGAARQIDWIVRLVPEDRRAFAEAHLAEARAALEDAREQRGPLLEDVVAAIRADPFAPASLQEALSRMTGSRTDRREMVTEELVSLLAQFTPDEREVFAANLEERLQQRREERRERAGG